MAHEVDEAGQAGPLLGAASVGRGTRALARRASLLLSLTILPLLLLIVGLGVLQYFDQRRTLLGDIARRTDDHRAALEALLDTPIAHVGRLGSFMEERITHEIGRGPSPYRALLRRAVPTVDGVPIDGWFTDHLQATDPSGRIGFAMVDPARHARLDGRYSYLDATLDVLELMRLGHQTSPHLQWSYVFSADADFAVVYPQFPSHDVLAAPVAAGARSVRDILEEWNGYQVFRQGVPAANPTGRAYWTDPYLDAIGAGWMISHARPVYDRDRFVGIVAADILLSQFAQLLDRMSATPGTIVLTNATGQVLAVRGPDAPVLAPPMDLRRFLPASLADIPQERLLVPSHDFQDLGDTHLLSGAAGGGQFHIVHLVSEQDLLAALLPRYLPTALLLLGLLVAVGASVLLLGRFLVRPGLALVRHIQAEAAGGPVPPVSAPGGWRPWFATVTRAFTESRTYQKRLETSEAEYRAVVETQSEFVVRFSRDSRVLFTNDAFCRHVGLRRDVLVGSILTDHITIDSADFQRLKQGLDDLSPACPIMAMDLRVTLPDGRICCEEWTETAVFGADGEVIAIQAVGRDVTERKETAAAMERQREALHQSEKLAALGAMLAGVAHELNNPLSVVIGYAGMLDDAADTPLAKERAGHLRHAAERCAKIVNAFLAMARARPTERRLVAVDQVLADALALTGYALRTHSIGVSTDLPPGLPLVSADRDQLHQVFLNLIVNAQQALATRPHDRRLAITAGLEDDRLIVEFADNGPGMDQAVERRVFEPFFTTKPAGTGTGIGLSVSRGIVEAHGGSLSVATAPGQGATFRVVLPATCATSLAEADADAMPEMAGGTGQILVVDDEEELAELIAEQLCLDGFEVDVATGGAAALDLIRTRGYDLLVTDLRMPLMDGMQLIAEVGRLAPGLAGRVIVLTGDLLGPQLDARLAVDGLTVLEKPLDFKNLRAHVRHRMSGLAAVA